MVQKKRGINRGVEFILPTSELNTMYLLYCQVHDFSIDSFYFLLYLGIDLLSYLQKNFAINGQAKSKFFLSSKKIVLMEIK
jgi:hypothetical protein